jgi:hypothetical protein
MPDDIRGTIIKAFVDALRATFGTPRFAKEAPMLITAN